MADEVTYRVVGGRELRKALKDADGNLKDLSAVHRRIAGLVAPEAVRRAPVLSGALASTVRGSGTTTQARLQAGGKPRGVFHRQRKRRDGSISVGRRIEYVDYAWIVEARSPYLAAAIDATRDQWMGVYDGEMERITAKVNNSTGGA